MKKLLVSLAGFVVLYFSAGCFADHANKNFVIDHSGILDSLQKEKLNQLYTDHEKKTSNEIVLLTTDSYFPDSTFAAYALRNFNELGIGKKYKNNGVLIVFSASLRKTRITTGLGTEKVLTDSIAREIIGSEMLPDFIQQRYFEGLWKGSVAITNFLEKPENKIK